MGLLRKTLSFRKKEKASKEGGGLLNKALEYSEAQEKEVSRGEAEAEETAEGRDKADLSGGQGKGLLERAETFTLKVEGEQKETAAIGLLKRAQALQRPMEPPPAVLPETAPGLEPEGVITEEPVPGEAILGEEEIFEKELESRVFPEKAKPRLRKKVSEEKAKVKAVPGISEEPVTEAVAGETAEVQVQKKPAEGPVKTVAELLDEYLQSYDSIRILQTFDEVVRKEGYSSFISHVAEMCLRQGKGKSVFLYLAYGKRYTVEYHSPESVEMKKVARKSVKKDSGFACHLANAGAPVRSNALKDEGLRRNTVLFEALEPWTALPLQEGADLFGFFIIGNQSKKPRLDSTALELSARLSAGYIGRYLLERRITQQVEEVEGEKRTTGALLDLYRMTDRSGTDLVESFEEMCRNLAIYSAVLITGWGGKGKVTVKHSIGMTEKLLKKYKIQKNDREMQTIIQNRQPSVLKDAGKRIAKFAGEKQDLIKTYITAPVLFGDELLGVVNIHKMKGAGAKIPAALRERIEHGVRSLIPYFLDWKIREADPFNTLASLLMEETEAARSDHRSLHFILFTLGTEVRAITPQVFGELALKVYEILRKYSESVKRIDLLRTLLLVRDLEDVEVDEIIKKGKNDFKKYLSRKKLPEAPSLSTLIIRYPQECKNAQDILHRVYGVT